MGITKHTHTQARAHTHKHIPGHRWPCDPVAVAGMVRAWSPCPVCARVCMCVGYRTAVTDGASVNPDCNAR